MKKLPSLTFVACSSLAIACVVAVVALAGLGGSRVVAQDQPAAQPTSPPEGAQPAASQPAPAQAAPPETTAAQPAPAQPAAPAEPTAAPVDPAAQAAASALLKQSRDALASFSSISATVKEVVVVGGRRIEAEGQYLQGKNLQLRLEFNLKLGVHDQAPTGSILQICNGHTLWTVQYLTGLKPLKQQNRPAAKEVAVVEDKPKITRRDVRAILAAAKGSAGNPEDVLVAELGLGGLPAILASLETTMDFQSVRDEDIRGKTLKVLEGSWKKPLRDKLLDAANAGLDDKQKTKFLPMHLPDTVQVYLDPENSMFPRRIVYRKLHPQKNYEFPMVTIAFADISLNGPVDEKNFEFDAPVGVPQDDITARYTEMLKPREAPKSDLPASSTIE